MLLPLLDDQPDLLAPRAALLRRRAAASRDGAPLIVSQAWRIAPSGGEWTVHVDDRARETTWQFALTRTSLEVLRRLAPGETAPTLDAFTEAILVDAGILVAAQSDIGADADILPTARASFATDQFAVVPDALHPYHVAALRRYLRNCIRIGAFPFGDPQVTRRYYAHNDPVLRVCQERLLPLVTHVVGVPIKRSYVYLSAYTPDSVLPPHRDRSQCQYSITLQVDYTPEPALETGWPIRLTLPDVEVTVYQSLGDALVFAGCQHVHFRYSLPPGHISTSVLLHYVDSAFEGSLE
jgi:hypothetical protein